QAREQRCRFLVDCAGRRLAVRGNHSREHLRLRQDGAEEVRLRRADQHGREVLDVELVDQRRLVLEVDPHEAGFGVGGGRGLEDGTVRPTGCTPLRAQAGDQQTIVVHAGMVPRYHARSCLPATGNMLLRAPGVTERRVFVALASAYALLTLAVLPWATTPGPNAPYIIAVCNGGIALADICTALLLAREFYRRGRIAFLLLACSYAYGAALAITQALAFPGAVFATRV